MQKHRRKHPAAETIIPVEDELHQRLAGRKPVVVRDGYEKISYLRHSILVKRRFGIHKLFL